MALPHFKNPFIDYDFKNKKVNKNVTKIYTTGRLRKVLHRIKGDSLVAQMLLLGNVDNKYLIDQPANYVDISHSDPTKISYMGHKKINQIVKNISFKNGYSEPLPLNKIPSEHLFKGKGRVKIKFGSFVNKIFKDIDPREVEKFSSMMKAIMLEPDFTMQVVEGEDIRKYYHHSWHSNHKGSLGISCMRHDGCARYFNMYTENPKEVKMLIMFDRDSMVKARALLWTLDKDNGLEDEFKFMDRVYTTNDDQVHHFFEWAKQHGYAYKEKQSWNTPYRFQDGDKKFEKKMKINLPVSVARYVRQNGGYGVPYLDTFKWMNIKTGTMYNYKPSDDPDRRDIYTPVSTNGDVYGFSYIKEDTYHKEYWYEGEIRWVEYLDSEVCERYLQYSNVNNTYILKDHVVYESYINDYIFNEEYEKFNNRETIDKIIEQKKEQERIRLEKIKKSVMKTVPYFKIYMDAANQYLDGEVTEIRADYTPVDFPEGTNGISVDPDGNIRAGDGTIIGNTNTIYNNGYDGNLQDLFTPATEDEGEADNGNGDGSRNFQSTRDELINQLSDLMNEGFIDDGNINRSFERYTQALRDRMAGNNYDGDQQGEGEGVNYDDPFGL